MPTGQRPDPLADAATRRSAANKWDRWRTSSGHVRGGDRRVPGVVESDKGQSIIIITTAPLARAIRSCF